MKFSELSTRAISHFPIVGSVVDAPASTHILSLRDVLYTQALSTAPTWLSALALLIFPLHEASITQPSGMLSELFGRGEVLLYSTATLAPVFMMAISDKKYPGRAAQLFVSIILLLLSGFVFGGLKVYRPPNPLATLAIIVGISLAAFTIAVILQYVVGVHQYVIEAGVRKYKKREEKSYVNKFDRASKR